MTPNPHIAEDDLALYAAGTLPAAEKEATEAHLLVCARCAQEARQKKLALAAYAQSTPETPQERIASVQPAAPVQERKPGFSWRTFFSKEIWSPAMVGALAVLLAGVGLDDLQKTAEMRPLLKQAERGAIDSAQLAQLMDLLTSPQARRVALHPGPVTAPPPEGRVVYEARTGKLMLTASNLQPLPQGKTYELWILQPGGKKPLPAGTFAPDSTGNAAMILADVPPGLTVQGFGVTIENAGGSETPTLPMVLSGL